MARFSLIWLLPFITFANGVAAECFTVDYLTLPISPTADEPERLAISQAYPESTFSPDGTLLRVGNGAWIEIGDVRNVSPAERLEDTRVMEQFLDVYPLAFDLEARGAPYFDPGRLRNDAFFRALYGDSAESVRQTLTRVSSSEFPSSFHVTEQQNVACQLEAVLTTLEAASQDYSALFSDVGGGFNWRTISGTSRLSAHSYGIAVDVNAELGQYWRWTGAQEGNVGAYENRIPQAVVETFERYGFIWGGKWHHFDGMHFEFRPEMIIYARLVTDDLK